MVFSAFVIASIIVLRKSNSLEYETPVLKVDHEDGIPKKSSAENDTSYKFIVMTKSAPKSVGERELLRTKGWLCYDWKNDRDESISWRHYFLVGLSNDPDWPNSKLEEENEEYSDIMITPTLDKYHRLTFKLMAGMQQAISNVKFKFLVVLSEDTIVNVNGLDKYLTQIIENKKDIYFHGGALCYQRVVLRGGKFATSEDQWPHELYPQFCVGTGLIFSFDTTKELLRVWREDQQPLSGLDDVQIGFLNFYSRKIKITQIPNITHGCHKNKSDSFIITQIKPLEKGAELMDNFMKTGIYCAEGFPPHPE